MMLKCEEMENETLYSHQKPQNAVRVLKKFRLIYGTVKQHFREVEEHCGISGSQLWLLQEIQKTPNIGVSNLASLLSIHQSTCSQLVEKLSKTKLIIKVRSSEDQRRVGLCITELGAGLLAKAPIPLEGVLPKALSHMSPEVLLQLDYMLEMVIAQINLPYNELESVHLSEM